MNAGKRPVSVLILSWLFIAVGVIAFANYFPALLANQHDAIWIELTELLALIAGVFMLRGENWARWLALAWMAFHVAISFPILREAAIHALIFVVMAWLLLRQYARRYFARRSASESAN